MVSVIEITKFCLCCVCVYVVCVCVCLCVCHAGQERGRVTTELSLTVFSFLPAQQQQHFTPVNIGFIFLPSFFIVYTLTQIVLLNVAICLYY